MENSGKINILIEEEPFKIRIKFEDSGSGIPTENLTKIFEPLFTTKENGTGLDLGICKMIIEKHGGIMSVKNNPTTFTI